MGVKPAFADVMVARYSREARRLELELSHERESRILAIRHSLESELLDVAIDAEQWTHITGLIDSLVPKIRKPDRDATPCTSLHDANICEY